MLRVNLGRSDFKNHCVFLHFSRYLLGDIPHLVLNTVRKLEREPNPDSKQASETERPFDKRILA